MPRPRTPDHEVCDDCGGCTGCSPGNDGCSCDSDDEDEDEDDMHRPTNKADVPATRRACGKCGRLGHLSRTCNRSPKAHEKLGVEVEGWWQRTRWSEVKQTAENWHMDLHDDGSLASHRDYYAQEFCTRPGSLGKQISQVVAVYPDAYHPSAGMHVHTSFKSSQDISSLNSKEFFSYFRERWESWGTRMQVNPDSQFWKRLRGQNDYCSVNTVSDTEDLLRGDRYKQLNFTSWGRHQTMEMRMLPLFRDAKLAISALEEWVTIFEDFLDLVAPSQVWAKYDREVAVDVSEGYYNREVEIEIPSGTLVQERASEVDLSYHEMEDRYGYNVAVISQRTVTVEADLVYSADERTESVEIPHVTPSTPGHVRIHGHAARSLEQSIRAHAPSALTGA